MGRLTKYVIDEYLVKDFNYTSVFGMGDKDYLLFCDVVEKLAHYEDMEEQGRLIVLKPRTDIAKDNFISALVNSDAVCPEDMGFEQEDSDCKHGCRKCWEKYLSGAKLKALEGDHFTDADKMGKE